VINLNLSKATRIGLNLVALLVAVVLLRLGESIFVPLTIAVMLAAILYPAATWLHKKLRFPWYLACFTAVFGLVLINLAVSVGFVIAIPRMLQDLPGPNNIDGQHELYTKFRNQLQSVSPVPIKDEFLPSDPEQSGFFQYFRKLLTGDYITNALVSLAGYFQVWFWQGILILFILLFLLLEGRMLARRVKEIFGPSLETQGQVGSVIAEIAHSVRNYLVWRTLVNIWLGIILGVAYSLLGLRQAWTWALLTMVLTYIPYLGTIVAGIPPVLDAFLYTTPLIALCVLLGYIVVVTIEGYLIVPLVMGRTMDLNATGVMVACLFWDLVWGLPGLFLAMPLMASVKAVCMNVPEWRAWGNLMGTEHGVEEMMMKERIARIAEQQSVGETTILMDDLPGDHKNGTPRK